MVQAPKASGSVLLIDDDVNFHSLVGQVVASLGHACVGVRSGEEGLLRIQEELPTAVILDGLLPGIRGEDVARRLRARYPAKELPIIFVTAFYRDLKSYRLLTDECGVNAVLHKPLVGDQLRSVLGPLLGVKSVAAKVPEAPAAGAPSEAERAQLLADYLAGSKEKTAAMRAAFHSLGGRDGAEALRSLRMEAHRLRGSGASFGFPEITRLAGAAEDLITDAGNDLLGPGPLRAKLDGLISALGSKVRDAAGAAPIPVVRMRGWRPKVLLVESEGELVDAAISAADEGEPLRVCTHPEEALRMAIDETPDVVLVGLEPEGAAICQRLHAAGIGPLVIMARGDSLAQRLMAVESGAVGYVSRPADLDGVFRIASAYARPRIGTRIVAAGGDRGSLNVIAEGLAPHGVAVVPAIEPGELLDLVERESPSLVILDVDSWKGGPELLRVLRACLRLRHTPVVAISGTGGVPGRLALLEAGAVTVIPKPFLPDELAAVVVALLSHRQTREATRALDPLTGLFDRTYLRQVCERSVSLARREGRLLAIVAFDANLDELRRREGGLVADEILAAFAAQLRAAFRDSDVVARIGPSRLAVLLHSVKRPDAERLVERQLEFLRSREFGVGGYRIDPAAALTIFPETSAGSDTLLESVDSKLNEILASR